MDNGSDKGGGRLEYSKSYTKFSLQVVLKLSLNFEILANALCVVQVPSTK